MGGLRSSTMSRRHSRSRSAPPEAERGEDGETILLPLMMIVFRGMPMTIRAGVQGIEEERRRLAVMARRSTKKRCVPLFSRRCPTQLLSAICSRRCPARHLRLYRRLQFQLTMVSGLPSFMAGVNPVVQVSSSVEGGILHDLRLNKG